MWFILRFGLVFPYAIPIREGVKRLKIAEQCGFDCIWIGDRTPLSRDPFVTATALALETEQLKIGLVSDPYRRHPALQAAAILTLNELTRGRAILGIGAGGPEELSKIGYKVWERPLTMLRESVSVIRRLFDGETVNFNGRMVTAHKAKLFCKSSRRIPIYVCGRGEQTLKLAGEIGDGVWAPSPLPRLKHEVNIIREGAKKAGRTLRELDIANSKPVFISSDRRKALKAAKRLFPAYMVMFSSKMLEPLGITESERDALIAAEQSGEIEEKIKCVTENMLDAFTIYGTIEDCIEKLTYLAESGVTQFIFNISSSNMEKSLRLIGEKVIPQI